VSLLHADYHAVVLANTADSQEVIESIKHGVLDCLTRPMQHEEVVRRLGDALRLAGEPAAPPRRKRAQGPRPGVRLVGQSPAMQEVYRQIGLFAPQEINVLITGESGTGKELVARAIVEHSPLADKPFMAINCAAIPETLLESELFGHEKGAFTGADRQRIGRFEQCHGGTLLLDEVGDLPPATQGKLLRVLQDRSFQRVGGNETITADVRILAATHQPLEQMIAERRFRQDLYYRLKVATIHMPALREREVDAVLLAHYFMDRIGRQMGSQVRSFDPEAVAVMLAYPWPGNVRELENVIRSSLAMARGAVFRLEYLPEHVRAARTRRGAAEGGAEAPASPGSTAAPPEAIEAWVEAVLREGRLEGERPFLNAVAHLERVLIRQALSQTGGRLIHAAELLGISRTTLRKKMRDHGIVVKAGPGDA
jgi:two-component system nitrogen regulation response regulator GlnG